MKITKEHIKILECLLYDNYSTEEISEILCIPQCKIRRHLRELFSFYKTKNITELKKIKNLISTTKNSLDISKKDRINYIFFNFFKTNIINLNKISLELNVSRRVLSKDLEEAKIILNKFDLQYQSLNSKGIELIGDEFKKKELFNLILFNLFIERNYLPNLFTPLFESFNQIITKDIQNFILKKIKQRYKIEHTYLILEIELLIYIGIIRNKHVSNLYQLKNEIKLILDFCNKNNEHNLFKHYPDKVKEVTKFLDYLNRFIMLSDNLPIDVTKALVTRFRLIDEFKKPLKVKKFYLFNKNFEKEHKDFYINLTNLIEIYFKKLYNYQIDTLDKITFFLILKEFVYPTKNINVIPNKNIIVYNFLQLFLLNNAVKDLNKEAIFISEIVSVYALNAYLKNNNVKNILIFENIHLENFTNLNNEIAVMNLSFPLENSDFFKIKKSLY